MSEIKPALSAEEWAVLTRPEATQPTRGPSGSVWVGGGLVPGVPGERGLQFDVSNETHGTVAALLFRQPFGFTWNDVDRHRTQAEWFREQMRAEPRWIDDHRDDAEWHESMADRIAALLPPKTP